MDERDRTLLIIEDDEGLQSQLKWHFDDFDTTIVTAGTREEAISALRLYEPAVIIQDLGLPPDEEGVSEGFYCIQELLHLAPHSKIIVLTGKNDHHNALKAIQYGAYDFYFKPVDTEKLDHVVEQAFRIALLEQESQGSEQQIDFSNGIVAVHPKMKSICRMIEKVAQTNITATLIGESGTGKELLTRSIHKNSAERDKPFVAINCAAVPENLMESELFGYEKGAFTGASSTTVGKIERANGGTLFLDEIGDMPLALQAKLLRFLQERVIERVGGRKEIAVDLRVVCATNKNLEQMVKDGLFREDLYYRICEIVIEIPPLRERGGDSVVIANHMLKKYSESLNQKKMVFSDEAISAIEAYPWPGNIREVENKVKRAVVMADGKIVTADDLAIASDLKSINVINLKEARKRAEVEAISSALNITEQNVTAAAKMLGVSRPTLYDMMKKYKMSMSAPINGDPK